MRHSIFIEDFGHFLGDHVAVVWNGNQRDFFPDLFYTFGRRRVCRRLFWLIVHVESIHHARGEKGSYSNASREERSGYVF
jgi:hypothetical protein